MLFVLPDLVGFSGCLLNIRELHLHFRSHLQAPGTCQWVGVPVKEKSDPATLWCGRDYDDAMNSCHKACPGEGDDECPEGMSCFSGSACTEEGVELAMEGYRCGTSWSHASETCGDECRGQSDCKDNEECFKDVVCASELAAQTNQGKYCLTSWDDSGTDCNRPCDHDDDCKEFGQWCYWVECETKANLEDLKPPEEEEEVVQCSAEVKRCPNGQYVGRSQQRKSDLIQTRMPWQSSEVEPNFALLFSSKLRILPLPR